MPVFPDYRGFPFPTDRNRIRFDFAGQRSKYTTSNKNEVKNSSSWTILSFSLLRMTGIYRIEEILIRRYEHRIWILQVKIHKLREEIPFLDDVKIK